MRVLDAASAAAVAEALEPRRLLSFSVVGPEFLAHGVIPDDQYRPAVASDASGDFVVVFENGPPGPSPDIYAHRFAGGDGESLGADIRVNSSVNGLERFGPQVAMDPDGDFVVTWSTYNANGGTNKVDVYARRFDAAGHPQGGEFRVNQTTAGSQRDAAVAMDADGDFVVAWSSNYHLYARRYGADGAALGDEFAVSVSSTNQDEVSVSMDADGDFVIVWRSMNQDPGRNHGIYGRRYDRTGKALPVAAGVPVGIGGEFRVNTTTAGDQMYPDVALDMDGDFVVAWTSNPSNSNGGNVIGGVGGGVFFQRYTRAGSLTGGETRANNLGDNVLGLTVYANQSHAAIDADGDFIVTWCSTFRYGDAPPYEFSFQRIMNKRYSADGTELPRAEGVPPGGSGNEFRTGDHNSGGAYPDVTRDAAGDAVVVWGDIGNAGTGSSWDVWGQRYDESTDPAGPIVSGVSGSGQLVVSGRPLTQPVSGLVVMFSEALDTAGGTGGPFILSNYRLTRDGADVSSLLTGVTFAFNPQTRKYEATLTLSGALPNGSYVLTVRQALRDLAGNALDGNLDGTPGGGDASVPFVVHVVPPPVLQSITVNGDGSAAQRSQVRSLTLNFDQPVTLAAGAARLVLFNTGGSGTNDSSDPTNISSTLAAPTSPDGGKTWVFTFSATSAFVEKTPGGASTGSLVDGVYSIDVDPAKVMGDGIAMAAPASLTFHRLFGDVDGNQSVNTLDFGLFRNALGKSTGQAGFEAAFDFDGNGAVNTLDYGQFRDRYGKAFTY